MRHLTSTKESTKKRNLGSTKSRTSVSRNTPTHDTGRSESMFGTRKVPWLCQWARAAGSGEEAMSEILCMLGLGLWDDYVCGRLTTGLWTLGGDLMKKLGIRWDISNVYG
jgi:hypothetical protein